MSDNRSVIGRIMAFSVAGPNARIGQKPSLELGRIMATREAVILAEERKLNLGQLVLRHAMGDWGHVDSRSKRENDLAVQIGRRVLSAYPIDPKLECLGYGANCLWVITEADRSSTTVLLPDEY